MLRPQLLAALTLVILGCGSRTSLLDSTPTVSTTATTPGTTSNGTGGAPPVPSACSGLYFQPQVMSIETPAGYDDTFPQLASAGDGHTVGLAFARRPQATPPPSPFMDVEHTALTPFADWSPTPPPLGSIQVTSPQMALTGAADGTLGVILNADPGYVEFCAPLDPFGSGGTCYPVAGLAPSFAAQDAQGQAVVGALDGDGTVEVTFFPGPEYVLEKDSWTLPCTKTPAGHAPVVAGTVPFGEGFLVASGNVSGPGTTCSDPMLSSTVYQVHWDHWPAPLVDVDVEPQAVAPHPEGLWLVESREGTGGAPSLRLARVDANAGVVKLAQEIPGAYAHRGSFAVAALGRSLALVWKKADAQGELGVRVIAESGSTVGEAFLAGVGSSDSVSVAASPEEDSLLVLWRKVDVGKQLWLARVDCVGSTP